MAAGHVDVNCRERAAWLLDEADRTAKALVAMAATAETTGWWTREAALIADPETARSKRKGSALWK